MLTTTIEYVIYGVKSPIPAIGEPDEGLLNAMKYNHEMTLRRDGVFGEIDHRVFTYPERTDEETGRVLPAWSELTSGGKKMIREVEAE